MTALRNCIDNNADLYDAVFRAHSLTWKRSSTVWSTAVNPPPYYSSFLLLAPEGKASLLRQVELLRKSSKLPFTIKDGFNIIEGEQEGLTLLFSASWIVKESRQVPAPWSRITTPEQLLSWEKAWSGKSPSPTRVFPQKVLDDPRMTFFGKIEGSAITSGCIVNHSTACVGLSNVFGGHYAEATACAASIAEGKPIVGYEYGDDFESACAAGFEAVAKLNVWLAQPTVN
jgi:hypothetical protein